MFPLGAVLLPGEALPLHVFEPRYLEMMRVCLAADEPCFGVVLIARGREVGGGEARHDVGTLARIIRVATTAQGTLSVVAVGTNRIKVVQWLTDDPYPRAMVVHLDDAGDPGDEQDRSPTGGLADLAQLADRVRRQAVDLGDLDAGTPASVLPLGQHDRYRLLCAGGPAQRSALLGELLGELDEIQRFRLGLPNM